MCWQTGFLKLLPDIQDRLRFQFRDRRPEAREEAIQAAICRCCQAYVRLVEQGKAEQAMARFHHQQALRLRGIGDFRAAAEELDHIIKTYPFYPLKFFALAQRIDCLFQAGESQLARSELRVLNSVSPNLAYLIEQRWSSAFQE